MSAAPVDYASIHFATRFPVTETACGKLGPSAGLWRYVTCLGCLESGPDDPRIAARIVAMMAAANDHGGSVAPANDVAKFRHGMSRGALAAHLVTAREEHLRAGAEIIASMPKRKRR
jgi:hypothetical protein